MYLASTGWYKAVGCTKALVSLFASLSLWFKLFDILAFYLIPFGQSSWRRQGWVNERFVVLLCSRGLWHPGEHLIKLFFPQPLHSGNRRWLFVSDEEMFYLTGPRCQSYKLFSVALNIRLGRKVSHTHTYMCVCVCVFINQNSPTHPPTNIPTHIYMYIYLCACVCVCWQAMTRINFCCAAFKGVVKNNARYRLHVPNKNLHIIC
jgi:hypothetical protein